MTELVGAAHRCGGIPTVVITAIMHGWSNGNDARRERAPDLAMLLPVTETKWLTKMLTDTSSTVRRNMARVLAHLSEAENLLDLIDERLGVETHRAVTAALLAAKAEIMRADEIVVHLGNPQNRAFIGSSRPPSPRTRGPMELRRRAFGERRKCRIPLACSNGVKGPGHIREFFPVASLGQAREILVTPDESFHNAPKAPGASLEHDDGPSGRPLRPALPGPSWTVLSGCRRSTVCGATRALTSSFGGGPLPDGRATLQADNHGTDMGVRPRDRFCRRPGTRRRASVHDKEVSPELLLPAHGRSEVDR